MWSTLCLTIKQGCKRGSAQCSPGRWLISATNCEAGSRGCMSTAGGLECRPAVASWPAAAKAACSTVCGWGAACAALLHGLFCSGLRDNQSEWRAAVSTGRGRSGIGKVGGGGEGGRVFTWEKNVDEMNGKGTCRRLLDKNKKENEILGDTGKSCRNTRGGNSRRM